MPVFSVLTSEDVQEVRFLLVTATVFTKIPKALAEIFLELQFLEKYGAYHFNFIDDTLTIDKKSR